MIGRRTIRQSRRGLADGRASGGSKFSPNDLGGLVLWLRADNGVTLNSTTVSAWADQSPKANNASQGTSADQPAFVALSANVNAPSVSYTAAVPDFMSISDAASLKINGDMFLATVMYIVSYPAGFATVISKGPVSEYDIFIVNTGAFRIVRNGSATSFATSVPTATKCIVGYNQASGTGTAYVNGVAIATGSPAAGTTTTNAVTIGKRSDAGTTLNGEQPEIVMTNRALTNTEILNVHRYLGSKYQIAVP